MSRRELPSPSLLCAALVILCSVGCERETRNPVLVVRPRGFEPQTAALRVHVTLNGIRTPQPLNFADPAKFGELDLIMPADSEGDIRIDVRALDAASIAIGRGVSDLEVPGVGRYEIDLSMNGEQSGWRWCHKCQGLFFAFNPGSVCPAGGSHEALQSFSYILAHGATLPDTDGGWRWCHKCQGLYDATNSGLCPKDGGHHDSSGSGEYVIRTRLDDVSQQDHWKRCQVCSGMYFDANPGSVCPGRQGGHLPDDTVDYALDH